MQNLTFSEVKLIDALRTDDNSYITKELAAKGFSESVIEVLCQDMQAEINKYSSNTSSKLYESSADELLRFSLVELVQEIKKSLPTLMTVICRLVEKKEHKERTQCLAATIVAKVLALNNQRLSAFRFVNGFVLNSGGAKDICISRFQKSGDTVAPQYLRKKVSEMSSLTSDLMKDWKESSIVYDNVNPYVKPRHQTSSSGNKLYSMTHGLMIRNRVPTAHLTGPPKPLHDITPSTIIPSDTDKVMVHEAFIRILCNTWAENVPSLSWMAKDVPRHKYSSYTRQKTECVSFSLLSCRPVHILNVMLDGMQALFGLSWFMKVGMNEVLPGLVLNFFSFALHVCSQYKA